MPGIPRSGHGPQLTSFSNYVDCRQHVLMITQSPDKVLQIALYIMHISARLNIIAVTVVASSLES